MVAWLRELIRRGLIVSGDIDDRSIEDVAASDLAGYGQHHFFAGIGGWSLALRMAGWPDDRPVWTGSCPCQPFSIAGERKGFNDDRHLWPAWFALLRQYRPSVCLGEQVAGQAGESWFDAVQADLEAESYACGMVVFPACSVGAPHQRQRLYWVADAKSVGRRQGEQNRRGGLSRAEETEERARPDRGGENSRVAAAAGTGLARLPEQSAWQKREAAERGCWPDVEWLPCEDGKMRPVEPGAFPLAHGVPARVVRLRGYGNAIVPPQAAEFIEAVMDVIGDLWVV